MINLKERFFKELCEVTFFEIAKEFREPALGTRTKIIYLIPNFPPIYISKLPLTKDML